jgi:hypothetical protein
MEHGVEAQNVCLAKAQSLETLVFLFLVFVLSTSFVTVASPIDIALAQAPSTKQNDLKELQAGREFWKDQVFSCKVGADLYPSKIDKTFDPMRRYNPSVPTSVWMQDYVGSGTDCDDADMAFFNGLLCASGEKSRGCSGVALAQDLNVKNKDGRWWRSKRRIGEADTADHASFSTEQGLGVLLYLVKTGNKKAFSAWLSWIENNAKKNNTAVPSYCTHKECLFKAIDCPLFVTVASAFGSTSDALRVCNPLRVLGIPTPDELTKQLEDSLNALLDLADKYEKLYNLFLEPAKVLHLPIPSQLRPSVSDVRRQINTTIAVYKQVRDRLVGPQIGEVSAYLAQWLTLLNALIDSVDEPDFKFHFDTGKLVYEKNGFKLEGANIEATGSVPYNPNGEHIAAVEILLLRNLGYQSAELNEAAHYAWVRDGENPFFEYLEHGRSDKMLDLIVKKCPSKARPSVFRFQWFPERGEDLQKDRKNRAWEDSMYWDCIFLANLYEKEITSSLSRRSGGINPLGDLAKAFEDTRTIIAKLQEAARRVNDALTDLDKKVKAPFCNTHVGDKLCPALPSPAHPCISVEQCGLDAFCAANKDNTICKVAKNVPLPRLPPGPITPVPSIPKPISIPGCPCSGMFCPC